MSEYHSSRFPNIAAISALLGTVVMAGTVFWRGGAFAQEVSRVSAIVDKLAQTVETMQFRTERLEQSGSASLAAHTDLAKVRNDSVERRLTIIEDHIVTMRSMQTDIREIRVRLEMYDQLLRHGNERTAAKTGVP